MKAVTHHQVRLNGSLVDYRVVVSPTAKKLRLRVGPNGVELVRPRQRKTKEVAAFLNGNAAWILDQLERVERLRGVRRRQRKAMGEILLRGQPTRVRVHMTGARARGNRVRVVDGEIVLQRGAGSRTPVVRSLERWLRRQAREDIESHLAVIAGRLHLRPRRVYVMAQRTKWGNCSSRRNLSFNWRLILAPEFVLRYMVTHEAVHLAVPDHSPRFWLMVQSHCPEAQRAKQWLRAHHAELLVDIDVRD